MCGCLSSLERKINPETTEPRETNKVKVMSATQKPEVKKEVNSNSQKKPAKTKDEKNKPIKSKNEETAEDEEGEDPIMDAVKDMAKDIAKDEVEKIAENGIEAAWEAINGDGGEQGEKKEDAANGATEKIELPSGVKGLFA